MINEIRDTPRALACVLDMSKLIEHVAEELYGRGIRRLLLTGCGSSYYAALAAVEASGSPFSFEAFPSSELLFYKAKLAPEGSAVVGISRSGRTAETVAALREAKARGIITVTITCSEDSPMATDADSKIVLDIGEERSIIMTKTFSSLSLASAMLCDRFDRILSGRVKEGWKLEELPEAASRVLKLEEKIKEMANAMRVKEFFIVLGQGPAHPVALEGALKLMETASLMTKALHSLEFRHGPMATVDERVGLLLIALKDDSTPAMARLADEMRQQGLSPIVISNAPELECDLELPWRHDPRLSTPVAIIPLQLLSFYISVNKGLNPDSPRRLHKFVGGF